MKLEFGPWLPDRAALGHPGMTDARNVVPTAHGYAPFNAISPYSDALTARCQGAWATKDDAGSPAVFAGDATKLYKLLGATWDDVSRLAGGAYACPAENQWQFTKFKTNAIAVNGSDAPQKFTLTSSSDFSALGGSPPTAKFVAVIREFLVLANIVDAQNRVQWSGSNNEEGWTAGVGESNSHDAQDGGPILRILGGEVGYIFQARQITRMVRVPAPITFQFDVIEQARGIQTLAPYAAAQLGPGLFYLGQDGFYYFNGTSSEPIGEDQVDATFFGEVNTSYYDRISVAVDPINKRVMVAYPTGGGGLNSKVLFWHWPSRRWSYAVVDTEILFQYYSAGTSLDALTTPVDSDTVSYDSALYQGGNQSIGAFDSNHKLAFFNGATLEATMITSEGQVNDQGRAQVQEVTPLIDTSAATVAIGKRERQADAVAYGSAASQQATGICPVRSTGRFHRAKVSVPAATIWTKAQGVDIGRWAKAGRR